MARTDMPARPTTRARPALAAAAAIALAWGAAGGCARMPPRAGAASLTRAEVFSVRWVRRLMPALGSYRDRANPFQGSSPEIDRPGARVFVGSADEHVYCLEATTGRTIWRRDLGAAVRSRPLFMLETNTVFVGTDDGELVALGADQGEVRWTYDAEGEIHHQPVLDGEALYLTAADNAVHAVDWTTGSGLWTYRTEPSEAEFEVSGFAGVAVRERVVFTGFSNGTVVALDAFDGSVVWSRDLAADIEQRPRISGIPTMPDVDTTPEVDSDHVYVASHDAGLYALGREAGSVVWRQPIEGVVGITAAEGTLYLARAGFGVAAVAAATGRQRWEQRLGPSGYSRPVVHRDLVVVGDSRRGLAALRRADGAVLQIFPVGSGAGGAPAIVGSRAFVLSNGGMLAALSIR